MPKPLALPVIADCSGCGECCRHVGTPPGYALVAIPGARRFADSSDKARWARMPAEVRATLEDYYAGLQASGWPRDQDRSAHDMPCLWFDEATQQCRHHKWRPRICRDFEVGGTECLAWRAGAT